MVRHAPRTITRRLMARRMNCEARVRAGCWSPSSCSCSPWAHGCGPAFRARSRATTRRSSSSRFRRAPGPRRSASAWLTPVSSATGLLFRVELARTGAGAASSGRRIPVRSPDDRRERSSRRSRVATSISVPITFREGLTIKQMGELFEARDSARAADFVARRREIPRCRDARSAAHGSRRLSVPGHLRAAATRDRRAARRAHGRRIRKSAHARAARRAPPHAA